MALNAYLRLVGRKTGEIKGSVREKGREGKIMVIAVSHDIASPRDAGSGLATGKRRHSPLVVTKEVDRSSPLLHQAMAANETFKEWVLQFWAPSITASETQHFTITLTDAAIASISRRMPNNKHPDLMRLETFEEIGFTYATIQWTWTEGDITAVDEWGARSG